MEEGQQAKDKVAIVVDHRERRSQVVAHLQSQPGIHLTFEQLKLGDYQVRDWLFERKTLGDFAESIIDGRLFSQARRLAAAKGSMAIILEGTTKDTAAIGLHRNAMQGAVLSLALIFQIPILRSRSPEETAQLMVIAGHQLRRVSAECIPRCGRRPKRRRRLQLHVLQGLPGVGPHRAEALLNHFGTVRGAFTASEGELCQVRGLSRVSAAKIEWILGADEIADRGGAEWNELSR